MESKTICPRCNGKKTINGNCECNMEWRGSDGDDGWEDSNLELLKNVYSLYEEVIAPFDAVCQQKCASCCTCNVTMTSLEAALLVAALTEQEKKELQIRIALHSPVKRYIPKMTTNMFARMCIQGKDIPEEENDPSWGKCPLLLNDMCSLYDVRPFGCRALISEILCEKAGYAQMPPLALTINDIFLQYIEHMDEKGIFGNLSDMLTLFLLPDTIENLQDHLKEKQDSRFVSNEKIAALMVPPEHRQKLNPLFAKLSALIKK